MSTSVYDFQVGICVLAAFSSFLLLSIIAEPIDGRNGRYPKLRPSQVSLKKSISNKILYPKLALQALVEIVRPQKHDIKFVHAPLF